MNREDDVAVMKAGWCNGSNRNPNPRMLPSSLKERPPERARRD